MIYFTRESILEYTYDILETYDKFNDLLAGIFVYNTNSEYYDFRKNYGHIYITKVSDDDHFNDITPLIIL